MAKFWRQGDIVFERVEDAPGKIEIDVSNPKEMVVKSETGHNHVIRASVCQMLENRNPGLIESNEPITVEHEQHATLVLPEGRYRVRFVGQTLSRMGRD